MRRGPFGHCTHSRGLVRFRTQGGETVAYCPLCGAKDAPPRPSPRRMHMREAYSALTPEAVSELLSRLRLPGGDGETGPNTFRNGAVRAAFSSDEVARLISGTARQQLARWMEAERNRAEK